MPTLYELSQQQQELHDTLYWLDSNDESAVDIQIDLDHIYGSVEYKLKFLSTLLLEAKAITAARKEIVKNDQARLKTSENAEERLREFIKAQMEIFDIKKIQGDHCNITLCAGRESVALEGSEKKSYIAEVGFDCTKLPYDCYEVVTVMRPNSDAIKAHIENGELLQGAELVKKHYLLVK